MPDDNNGHNSASQNRQSQAPDPMPHFQRRVGQTRIQVFLDDEAYNEYLHACGDIDCTFSDLVRACLEIGSPVLQRHPKSILPILGAEVDFIKRNR